MDHVRNIAQHMMKKYKTNDPFEIAEYLKMKIMYEDLGKNINGFYQSCPKIKIIHINNKLGSEARRIVCAHELGHAVLHSKVNIMFVQKHTFCDKGKFERQAIIFAAELLIPNGLLLEHPDYSIDQIAALHNISLELLKHKYNI